MVTSFFYAVTFAVQALGPQPFPVQYARSFAGQNVMISIDGGPVHATFAGKLGFRDRRSSWTSVCADVRSPIAPGQFSIMRALSTAKVGGNIALAGNIVARYFRSAQTADQCAGLQLAVWEAIEDGGSRPDFYNGSFQARASQSAIAYAEKYYQAIEQKGDAVFLETGDGGGQDQISSGIT